MMEWSPWGKTWMCGWGHHHPCRLSMKGVNGGMFGGGCRAWAHAHHAVGG